MLIQSIQQIQERRLKRTLSSYWMKFFDERPMQRRWYFFETLSMKIDLCHASVNTSRTIRIEQSSEYQSMMRIIRLFGIDSLKQMKKQRSWMNESMIQTENTHHLNQKEEDCEAYHSIRTICWFLMSFDSTSYHVIWFNMMRIADDTNSISFRLVLTQPSAKRNEAMNMQSMFRDSLVIESIIWNQSDWDEKRKIFEQVRTLCFSNIKDTTQEKWLLKQSHISKYWRMCSRECEWMFKNTKQSKIRLQD